ncbi:MAG: hypothetical protein MIO93_08195 [ANME-2 cluster archaeon]|nr:hypothetical protein [ANME-2 cluster archaeon]
MLRENIKKTLFRKTIAIGFFSFFIISLIILSNAASITTNGTPSPNATDATVDAKQYYPEDGSYTGGGNESFSPYFSGDGVLHISSGDNSESFRVAFCQQPRSTVTTVPEKTSNMKWALKNMADVAVANGADMIVFSAVAFVTYDCGPRPILAETVPSADPDESPIYYQMAQYAKENNIWIYYGDYVKSVNPDKPYNSGIMIKPDGELAFIYNKHYGSNSEINCGTYGGSSYTFDIGHPLGKIGCLIGKDFLAGGLDDIKNLDFDFMLGIGGDGGDREVNDYESWMSSIITSSPRKKNGGIWVNFADGGGSFFMDKNSNVLENVSGGGNLIRYLDYPLGNIIVDPDSKSWLAYNRDSDGDGKKDPCFICGPGDPEDFLYRGAHNANGSRDGDQMTLINKMKGTGANSIYLMAVRSHGGDGDSTQNPFIDSDPTKGLDDDILNQWETWFTEMDNNGIIIYFFFYDDSTRIWNTDDTVAAEERTFIYELVKKFGHHRNLIWCVAEEYEESYSAARVSNIAAEIRTADDYNHVIAVHKLPGLDFSEFADDPNIDQFAIQWKVPSISANHADMVTAWNNAKGRYNLNLAEPDNEYGTVEFSRMRNWAVAMGGAYIMPIEWNIASTDEAYLEDCGRLVRFMESTNLSEMVPHDEIVTGGTGYCLANPGGEYVLYLPSGGSVTIDLSDAIGTLDAEWYDPKDGTYYAERTVIGGGSETFTPPFFGDAVLHIVN